LIALIVLLAAFRSFGQPGVTTFGIQVKPVIPLDYFDPLTIVEQEHRTGSIELKGGFLCGMNVRVGITPAISFETGISQIRRAYAFSLVNDTNGYSETGRVRFTGYEVPVMALIYIRLGERTWMNTALGASIDMYPSDAQRDIEKGRIYIFKYGWARFGIMGNLGVEYRTDKSGIFYLGGSFHRPFNDMALAAFTYYGPNFFPYEMRSPLDGSYLTLDLRYYFHEDPERIRRRALQRQLE